MIQSDNSNVIFIKIIAIAFVTVVYSFGGFILTLFTDRYLIHPFYDKTDKELEEKTTEKHIGETTIILAVVGIVAYIGRNALQKIPFPLDGIYGFKYKNVKEVSSGALILWILINYSPILERKIKIIRKRLQF